MPCCSTRSEIPVDDLGGRRSKENEKLCAVYFSYSLDKVIASVLNSDTKVC